MSRVASRAAARHDARHRALTVLLVVAVVVVIGVAADTVAAPTDAAPAAAVAQPAARAGTWYCPAVGGEGERTVLTIAAVGDEASQVIVDRYGTGRAVADDPVTLEPGQETVVAMSDADAMAPATVRWSGGPAVTTWRVEASRVAAAPCEPAPAERWYIPGFSTMLGAQATLHLSNPYTAPGTVRVMFADAEGLSAPVLTDNVFIPPGVTRSLNLRRFQPEKPDLGVVVEVLAGRVIAQGELNVTPPKGTTGASGRLMLPAAREPSQTWAFARAVHEEGSESWLSVLNPGDDPAAVEIRVSAPSDDASGALPEVSIAPGGSARVELAGASSEPSFGVSVNVVNDQPVVVSRLTATTVRGAQVLTGGRGASTPATEWALLGGGTQGWAGAVSLYNPGAEPATVDVVAEGAPPEWSGIAVPPNGRVALDLAAAGGDRPSIPVLVRSDVPIVAELQSTSTADPVRLWSVVGVPDRQWLGRSTRPAVVRDPLLSTRRSGPAPTPTDDIPAGFDDGLPPTDQPPPTEPAPATDGAAPTEPVS